MSDWSDVEPSATDTLIAGLRAKMERLQAENERLRSTPTNHVCVECGGHILFSRRHLCGHCARPEAERDTYEQMQEVAQRNIELRSENERLREALGLYADEKNWGEVWNTDDDGHMTGLIGATGVWAGPGDEPYGIAREALQDKSDSDPS